MKQNTIALICDCDSTLAPDTTNFLLKENKINIDSFWDEVGILVENGWDPPLAWMTKIMNFMHSGEIDQNTNKKLNQLGTKIETYNNVKNLVSELRSFISNNNPDFAKAGVKGIHQICSFKKCRQIHGKSKAKLCTQILHLPYLELYFID